MGGWERLADPNWRILGRRNVSVWAHHQLKFQFPQAPETQKFGAQELKVRAGALFRSFCLGGYVIAAPCGADRSESSSPGALWRKPTEFSRSAPGGSAQHKTPDLGENENGLLVPGFSARTRQFVSPRHTHTSATGNASTFSPHMDACMHACMHPIARVHVALKYVFLRALP